MSAHRRARVEDIHELAKPMPFTSYDELAEVVQDAWLARASRRRAAAWLAERGLAPS